MLTWARHKSLVAPRSGRGRWLRTVGPWFITASALLVLLRTELQWPAFQEFERNLAFGPFHSGGSLTQTLRAPRTALRTVAIYPIGEPPSNVQLRVFAIDRNVVLIAEAVAVIDPEGRLRWNIPAPVITSGKRLQLQIVNPPESGQTLTVEANFADPYSDGEAAANGDPGDGRVDIRITGRRVVRVWDFVTEVWQATAPGFGFLVLTVLAAIGLLRAWLRSWGLAAAVVAVGLAAGFPAVEPWPG